MRIEQLQAFLSVVETGSFQQTAHKFGMTQSTISRQIQTLETEVGLPLFHRSSPVKLTLAGDRLLPRVRKICQEWETAIEELAQLREGKQPELCIAAIHSVCAYQLPPLLQRFCLDYPGIQLRVTALGSDRALKVLKDGLVDVAIVMHNRFWTASPEMLIDPLYEDPIEVLLSTNHPLAQYDQIPWPALAEFPQVVFKDGYGMQRLVQEQFQQRGLVYRPMLELNTLDAFRGIVRQGTSIALLPHSALLEVNYDPLLTVRPTTAPVILRQVVLVTTQDRLRLPPIQHFCTLIKQYTAKQ